MSRQYFNPATITRDLSAGFILGIESIPSGLAMGLLALVNPIYGVYGYMMGAFSGAFFTSSVYMSVQGTGAMALVIASVPQVRTSDDPNRALFTLSILTGIIMLTAGLFKLGSLTRFVPNSVMVGFVNAVALLIILGQLDNFTGYDSAGANKLMQAFDLLLHLGQIQLETLMVGINTIVLILVLEKTDLKALGLVVAMLVASLLVPLFGWNQVALVSEIAQIPRTLPLPTLPSLETIPGLLIPAFSLAFVGLMQGVGISKSVPNPDGAYPDISRDFVGQGAANIVSGVFQGTPVGGSLSATSILTNAGAQSRFANISAGIVMAIVILLFGRAIGAIAMPALAGLLIVIGFRTLKPAQVESVWKTGTIQRAVMTITFVSALLIPLQYAVLMGVALAVLLYVLRQSNSVKLVQWKWKPGELPVESDAPEFVQPNQVTILIPYGSDFYAAAPVFEDQLPKIAQETRHAVVIIVLRERSDLGSTFLDVLASYGADLSKHESRLVLAGVHQETMDQIRRTGLVRTLGRENIFPVTERVGESMMDAEHEGEKWIDARQ